MVKSEAWISLSSSAHGEQAIQRPTSMKTASSTERTSASSSATGDLARIDRDHVSVNTVRHHQGDTPRICAGCLYFQNFVLLQRSSYEPRSPQARSAASRPLRIASGTEGPRHQSPTCEETTLRIHERWFSENIPRNSVSPAMNGPATGRPRSRHAHEGFDERIVDLISLILEMSTAPRMRSETHPGRQVRSAWSRPLIDDPLERLFPRPIDLMRQGRGGLTLEQQTPCRLVRRASE